MGKPSSRWLRRLARKLGSIIRNLIKWPKAVFSFWSELPGVMLQQRLDRCGRPLIFRDWAGHHYWQYPGLDNIRFNWKRGSVTDAKHIVRYVLEHVQPGWTCVDLGANIGAVSIPLWKKVGPDGRVISVEADPSNIARIRANLNLNNCPEGSVVNVAIANRKGTVQLRCYPAANGWQTLGNPSFAKDYQSFVIDVPAITFCELAESYGLESVDFVKIDVEGAEILVLAGMRSFLRDKKIGCVIFEVNHLMLEGMGHTVSELLSFWDSLDYDLWRLNEDGIPTPISNGWPDVLVGDWVALPQQ